MSNFEKVLNAYTKQSFSTTHKGNQFECLMQRYLQTEPIFTKELKTVWLWHDFPFKDQFDNNGRDVGIDLVAETAEQEYWAVQCKFVEEHTAVDKQALDSFLSTSSKKFHNEQGTEIVFNSRLWITTSTNWGAVAEKTTQNQSPEFHRIDRKYLMEAPVDWVKLNEGMVGEPARLAKKELRPHQTEAVAMAHQHFENHDRGRMIMACGTGKTFTSLRIAEQETNHNGLVLFLLPSIALLNQTLREWCDNAVCPITAVCVCSDPKASSKVAQKRIEEDADSTSTVDLVLPATTDSTQIAKRLQRSFEQKKTPGMTVVFATYQSIEVVAEAQKMLRQQYGAGFGIVDLIVCDEAHRTTGVTLKGDESTTFVKVHDKEFIEAKKRLYMTATPRLYHPNVKSKAAENEAILCSMDDATIYGEEFYHLSFGTAVEQNLLSDYKVIVLTVRDKDIPKAVQEKIGKPVDGITDTVSSILNADDASKIIGCINALSKRLSGDDGTVIKHDATKMKTALAFCSSIKMSEAFKVKFTAVSESYYVGKEEDRNIVKATVEHIDGRMPTPNRMKQMDWLKGTTHPKQYNDPPECRILSNVRCLSEGVDVPALDAVIFLSPKNSYIDVVQSVGRVMRKAPNKKYGYIIIPIFVPDAVDPNEALDKEENYKVVWSVLQALRAHDDRFNATINQIELNKKKPNNILSVGIGSLANELDGDPYEALHYTTTDANGLPKVIARNLPFPELQAIIYAKMVQKVGQKTYWKEWAENVATIAAKQVNRITKLIALPGAHQAAFADFLSGLQKNLNPSVEQGDAVDMLAQHLITKPIFETLFEGYSFAQANPISISMQNMLDILEEHNAVEDMTELHKFYESVKMRTSKIDNATGKQKIIIELYDTFFATAFPKMVEQLGIVYTPVEVVDFIVHSVNDILKKEFNRTLSDEAVHILDPFTGTGTFITRLLQSRCIKPKDLLRKYQHEIHANEIVLLAYYIAAINIENVFHDMLKDNSTTPVGYEPFEGICLTDTFQLGETPQEDDIRSQLFPKNSERITKQRRKPLQVIFGNPPYSVGQKSANDNAQNQSYPKLDKRIAESYVKNSDMLNKKSLYDSYIKAFRWSTDRLDKTGGIICFVSNGAWLDGNSTDGFRKSIEQDFTAIYVFNLRGNARMQGEQRRKEKDNIFKEGSRTPIAITLLVKNPKTKVNKATIHYHDIGDYLNREDKLKIIKDFKSFANEDLPLKILQPNEHGDWISMRNEIFATLTPLEPEKKFDSKAESVFITNAVGTATARDAWVTNFSAKEIAKNMQGMIYFYNMQQVAYLERLQQEPKLSVEDFIDTNPTKISWTRALRRDLSNKINHQYDEKYFKTFSYRPFCYQYLYHDTNFIESPGLFPKLFPTPRHTNLVICVSCVGSNKGFSLMMTNLIPDYHFIGDTQCFPLYHYEESKTSARTIFDDAKTANGYERKDAISDYILDRARRQYEAKNIGKEDIFYYVYGFLHSPHYRIQFANDLKKMLPRLPLVSSVQDFWHFSHAGKKLADLHIHYERVKPLDTVQVHGAEHKHYTIDKMRFLEKDKKDTILYNSSITLSNIPLKAYDYIVNGKSAIEWIMERYQVSTHKESGIVNNPNDWAVETSQPRYILDLLLSVISLSVQTVDVVAGLPKVEGKL
ncbi:MAG: DEAD/DEAH box helicase family protein [Phycisphaerales bacterium]|nr:DEAD/DEAH box helicase family protein [Phycisphaerales bacterium]